MYRKMDGARGIPEKRCAFLNEKQFKKLRYQNGLGTDFTVGLVENHIWTGGAEQTKTGVTFLPTCRPKKSLQCRIVNRLKVF